MKHILAVTFGFGFFAAITFSFAAQGASAPQQSASASANGAGAEVPRLIRFSGVLVDELGHGLKGPVGTTFALYAQQSGGTALWMETQNIEPDTNGNYSVLLGAASADGVPMDLFASGEARWLSVQAERQPEQPRVLLVSVPYALKAGDAQTLGGLPVNAFALAGTPSASTASSGSTTNLITTMQPAVAAATIGGTGTTDFIPLWTSSATLGNSILFQATSNSIGIGTTAPAAKLDVNGGATIRGQLSLPFTGTATSTLAFNSQPFDLLTSTFNSSTLAAVSQHFRWQAEPIGNNTTSPSGKLNLLFASGTATPAETGLSISNKGIITFAPGQTLPTVTGNETVNGNITASGSVSASSGVLSGSTAGASQILNVSQAGVGAGATITSQAGQALLVSARSTTSANQGIIASAFGPGGTAIIGVSENATGNGVGVLGESNGASGTAIDGFYSGTGAGTGVLGQAGSPNSIAVHGVNSSTSGVAGLFNNSAGGNVLQGQSKGATVFTVNGSGNLTTTGSISATNGTVSASSGIFFSALMNAGPSTLGGRVGIGTTFASAQLDVHDFASGALVDTLVGNAGCGTSFAGIGFLPGGKGFGPCTNYSLLGDGTNTYINAGPFGALHFRLTNGDAMIVNNNGRVGIGTTTPAAKLDVNGDANVSGVLNSGNLAVQYFANNTVTQGGCLAGFECGPFPIGAGMKLTETTATSPVFIMANVNGILTAGCVNAVFSLMLDGTEIAKGLVSNGSNNTGNTQSDSLTLVVLATPAPGSHTFEVQETEDERGCHEGGATGTNISLGNSSRVLIVREW